MEPITTLIALTAAVGFVWRALKAPPQGQKEPAHDLDYRPAKVGERFALRNTGLNSFGVRSGCAAWTS